MPSSQPSTNDPTDDDILVHDGILANPKPHNEHVGIDDEAEYLILGKPSTNELANDHIESSDSESDEEYEEGDGNIYPNMREFRLALSQHAIKHEFEFNIEKSDPGRVRVYCSRKKDEGCRWRLHARTMKDNITLKVNRNPHKHTCPSARSKVVRNATKFWVCEQVKDWIAEDASVGAKELVRRIKDKHKVDVPYQRVYDGTKLADKQLFGSWDSSFDNLYRFKAEV
ncbi:uncharacterized protein [Miscanthus floridulus]|uniref:uncharacterized protein n=1 Tax=Miscanthus floridulus TaxID=154761 RepID=UPI00345989EA